MFDFIQKITYFILSLQEKFLKKSLKSNFKSSYINGSTKKVFSHAASLELSSKTNQNKDKIKENITLIVKKYGNSPDKLLVFAKKHGAVVHKFKYADKVLSLFNLEEGLIPEIKGVKAFCLSALISLLTSSSIISFKTAPMFVFCDKKLDATKVLQHFYKWYSMKFEMPGFDAASQANFNKFLSPKNDNKISELSVEDILGLKEAIARDVEAINFVVELAKSTQGAKNALSKMTAGGASV